MKHKLLKSKFKSNLVKPLYKKVNPRHVLVTHTYNLNGHDFHVKREISEVTANIIYNRREQDPFLPGTCDVLCPKAVISNVYNFRDNARGKIMDTENSNYNSGNSGKQDKRVQSDEFRHNVSDTWLRVYPLPHMENESLCCTVFRCIACQIGLTSILVLWTLLWAFVINSLEEPYELKVAEDFNSEQNQLVIDLATELRQITPLSPKWREAIERRIQEEKQLTILAVGHGARLHPGYFWDLPGTFLFTVYVMTALGFGAPVPHTVWGRTAALVYAFIAVPCHFYLMLNASTCFVARCSKFRCPLKKSFAKDRYTKHNSTRSPTSNPSSEALKKSKCYISTRKKIMQYLRTIAACHCLPIALLTYYACGALAFGVLRERSPIDTAMFPLEFTTTGGLESVPSHVRVIYGFYVEGAMALLAIVLAILRRRSNAAINSVAEKYRLFFTV